MGVVRPDDWVWGAAGCRMGIVLGCRTLGSPYSLLGSDHLPHRWHVLDASAPKAWPSPLCQMRMTLRS